VEQLRIEWKMTQVNGYEVESTLTDLSNADYEIVTVQFTGEQWAIIAKKYKNEIPEKSLMGFCSK
jgi:hypothetical protein